MAHAKRDLAPYLDLFGQDRIIGMRFYLDAAELKHGGS